MAFREIKWSRDRRRHETPKDQTRDPNRPTLRSQYLENNCMKMLYGDIANYLSAVRQHARLS